MAAQEAALRQRPDVVIGTPGRLIDHVHNSPSFSLQDVEVLVLDEADRMLDESVVSAVTLSPLSPLAHPTLTCFMDFGV